MDMQQMNGHLAMSSRHLWRIISAYLTLLLRLLVPTDLASVIHDQCQSHCSGQAKIVHRS